MAEVTVPNFTDVTKQGSSQPTGNDKKRVLIIEDLGEMRIMLKSLMASMGYAKIDVEPSGQGAVKRILEGHYDIVLSDYNLGAVSMVSRS